jgi:hypothetical protein
VAKRVKRPIQRKVELAECGGMHLGGSPTLLFSAEVQRELPHGVGARIESEARHDAPNRLRVNVVCLGGLPDFIAGQPGQLGSYV